MSLCERCRVGGYHGFPPAGTAEWVVHSVWWWCPVQRDHDMTRTICTEFRRGEPRRYDEFGEEIR